MKTEDLKLLAQLIQSMGSAVKEMDKYFHRKEFENFKKAKQEVLMFQRQISKILKNRRD
jgi:hypothetical protein